MADRLDDSPVMKKTTVANLAAARRFAFATITFERLWPLILPLITLAALFVAIAWFGLFQWFPGWLHMVLLALFALAGAVALYLPTRLRLPYQTEVDRRLEAANLLEHGPISIQSDAIASGTEDPFARALWEEHRRRMAEKLKNLQGGTPRPRVPEWDPLGVRAAVALLFVTAFAYASGPDGGALSDAFRVRFGASGPAARIDAWVTPPRYTGRAPIFLTAQDDNGEAGFTVPQGSILAIRVTGGSGQESLTATGPDGKPQEVAPAAKDDSAPDDSRNFQLPLQGETEVSLSGGANTEWTFNIIPDRAPLIRFTKEPDHAMNGTLELSYSIDDDYGATKGHAEIVEAEKPSANARPLFPAPDVPLVLPRRGSKDATTSKDITEHPWAGSQVRLTLVAEDDAGHLGRSETKVLTLPERPFANPLARAMAEQRRILALDANKRDRVLDMLSAVTLRPEDTIKNTTHYLALRSVQSRLRLARNDDQLRDVVAYMWQVARGIEDGQLSDAEKRLRQAQEALKRAIENGASPQEIEKLMAELRQAMQQFLREYAERQQQSPYSGEMNPNARVLTQKDLDRMMNQIENLAKQGSRDSAQQLLSQLENMMNNLQMGRQPQRGQAQQDPMRQQMNKLGELMRRQQQMMDETSRLNRQMQEQDNAEVPDAGKSQELEEAMRKLQQGQAQLQSELNEMMKGLKGMGLEPGKEMGEAGESMGRAGEALGRAQGETATDEQANALDALRRGARDMMQQMQQAMGEGGPGGQQSPGGRDPLGRPTGPSPIDDSNVKIPEESDIQRARQILEEIRRRLGDSLSPQMEKEYLERLLKFD
ncbi:TIGR02302 family protein [Brucella endophytica]|uniref:TIGR02302 family protein n=1 Tax=Brucella endophytica TaxID=1963359 RepID=A0A916S9P6_9HYPH|nr:TIGR02302 family protein [Brucella endophytica]GGA90929.1 TIGR02302 family protein [Brucella endophytica]